MKMFRLYIGTTDGPTEIQRVTPEDPEVRSVVCLDGKAIALPISDDYDAFVRRPTGIVETLTGHPSYRVDISHPIGGGYSWQLGIIVAHLLDLHHCLAGPEDRPAKALWLTGEVDHNFNIGAVDDVGLKLTRATSTLKRLITEGAGVTVAVPDACADEARGALAAAFPDGDKAPRLVAASHLDEVLSAIGAPTRAKKTPMRTLALKAGRGTLGGLALAATAFAAIVVTAGAWPPGGATDSIPARVGTNGGTTSPLQTAAFTGAPPRITLIETRAPQGRHCAAVNFDRAKPVIARHPVAAPPEEDTTGSRLKINPNGLCDLRHRIVNSGLGTLAVAAIAARHDASGGRFRTRALMKDHRLDAGATFDLDSRPPPNLSQSLVQKLAVVALPNTRPQARAHLRQAISSLAAATSTEAWSRAIAALNGQKFFIARSQEIFRPGWVDTRKTGQTLP